MKVTRTGKRRVRRQEGDEDPHANGYWYGNDQAILLPSAPYRFIFSMTVAERRRQRRLRSPRDFWDTSRYTSTGPAALRRIAGEMIFNPKVAHKVIALFAGLVEEIEL